jgi:hypothetical protein
MLDFEFSSFKLIDPNKLIVSSDGSVFPVNQLIVRLTSAATLTNVQDIATSLGADIVGFAPSSDTWELETGAASEQQLLNLISAISTNPLVIAAFPNQFGQFFVTTDLVNLAACDPNNSNPLLRRAQAFDQVQLQQAWNFIQTTAAVVRPTTVGVIDTGLVQSHPEFDGIQFLANPMNVGSLSTLPGFYHGTSVSWSSESFFTSRDIRRFKGRRRTAWRLPPIAGDDKQTRCWERLRRSGVL